MDLALRKNGHIEHVLFNLLATDNTHQMKDVFVDVQDEMVMKLCSKGKDSIGREWRMQHTDFGNLCLRHIAVADVLVMDTELQVALQPKVQFTAAAAVRELMPLLDTYPIPRQMAGDHGGSPKWHRGGPE